MKSRYNGETGNPSNATDAMRMAASRTMHVLQCLTMAKLLTQKIWQGLDARGWPGPLC